MKKCRCHSGKAFQACCGRFLASNNYAKTPEQLMRSRYTAYALGGYGQYLLDTWAPETANGLSVAALSQTDTNWCRLEILNKSQSGDKASVEFKAYFLNDDETESVLHEHSTFERRAGRWLYVRGELFD